jgi:protein TonB
MPNALWNLFHRASHIHLRKVLVLIHSSNKTDQMEPLSILHADPLDRLFENRNKSYGAYSLRKYYRQRLLISLAITTSSVLLFSIAYLFFQSPVITTRLYTIPDTVIDPYVVTPEEPRAVHPPSRPAVPKPPASLQYNTPVIVTSQTDPKPMAAIEDLKTTAIGLKTSPGDGDPDQPSNSGISAAGTGDQKTEPAVDKPEILGWAEVMPEFPGGNEALKRFLLKNLQMPENNLEPGTDISVMARFVVGADGRVRDIEIIRPADAVFNMEVKRVLAKMPDWKPGLQNHRSVAVYFCLPVHFISAE